MSLRLADAVSRGRHVLANSISLINLHEEELDDVGVKTDDLVRKLSVAPLQVRHL